LQHVNPVVVLVVVVVPGIGSSSRENSYNPAGACCMTMTMMTMMTMP